MYFVTYTIQRRKNTHKYKNSAGGGFGALRPHGGEEEKGKYQVFDEVQQLVDARGAGIDITARN